MSGGYVYILINSSMPNLIKIGRTIRDSRERARELRSTGVPSPFEVAFELFSERHEELEQNIHKQLSEFRVAGDREFFRYPLKHAIENLIALSCPPKETSSAFYGESIFEALREKYRMWLKPGIADVRIVQTHERVWLEITEEKEIGGYLVDQIIKRTDLAFCVDCDSIIFSPKYPVSLNATKFIEMWTPYSIIMTTDLFHEDACVEIGNDPRFNPHKRKSA